MDEKKNILKSGGLKASSDFTSKVMKGINAEEMALGKILSEHGSMKASPEFATQLMAKLDGKLVKKAYKPVISKRSWIGLAAIFIGVVCLTLVSGSASADQYEVTKNIGDMVGRIGSFFEEQTVLMYSLTGALVLSVGLLIEQKVGSKN